MTSRSGIVRRPAAGAAAVSITTTRWAAAPADADADGAAGPSVVAGSAAVLLALADQPAISAQDYGRLITAWREAPETPAAAAYANTRGAPCIIPAAFRSELLNLRGDQGARAVLRSLTAVTEVPIDSAARDIDTRDDWQALLRDSARS